MANAIYTRQVILVKESINLLPDQLHFTGVKWDNTILHGITTTPPKQYGFPQQREGNDPMWWGSSLFLLLLLIFLLLHMLSLRVFEWTVAAVESEQNESRYDLSPAQHQYCLYINGVFHSSWFPLPWVLPKSPSFIVNVTHLFLDIFLGFNH